MGRVVGPASVGFLSDALDSVVNLLGAGFALRMGRPPRLEPKGGSFHNLRTRRAGARRFAFVELNVPGDWSVECADAVARAAEQAASERDVTLMVWVTPTANLGKAHGD